MTKENHKLPISVFIITLNEEHYLPKVLASCCDMDEVVIVDSGSTDKTLEIAQQFGAKIHHQDWLGYPAQKNYALSLCKNEWALNLDGDEELTPEVVECCKRTIENNKTDALSLRRREYFINKPFSPLTHQLSKCRLFRKSKTTYNLNHLVHEKVEVNGKISTTSLAFNHYGNNDISLVTSKNNLYSSKKAQEKFTQGKQFSYLKLLFIFPFAFFKTYFLRRSFFSGMRGFIQAILDAYYAFLKEAKLYEHYKKNIAAHPVIPELRSSSRAHEHRTP